MHGPTNVKHNLLDILDPQTQWHLLSRIISQSLATSKSLHSAILFHFPSLTSCTAVDTSFNQLNKEFSRLMAASMFHFPLSLNFSFVILHGQFVLLYDGLYKVYTIANFHTFSFSLDA